MIFLDFGLLLSCHNSSGSGTADNIISERYDTLFNDAGLAEFLSEFSKIPCAL